ncbi:phosphotransferase [Paenibacillus sp. J2TS4]|uniref:phosphotransferase n=1 Tax=Paenibacillus sp. J2TS4 TaxID=2807194 RepID=UPI001B20AE79|nr:phosphotransferase [Paenibacillus sp. J2TS4]GIP32097.1 aminoglycoside phosphotransferase [Paenibacillus sp. J2TS4]
MSDVQAQSILVRLKNQGILQPACILNWQMSGTTTGKVYTVSFRDEPFYVLKIDDPKHVELVASFLQTYTGLIFPKLHFVDPAHQFFVYEYIQGTANKEMGSKSEWLSALAESLINRYQRASADQGWGWLDEPLADSWPAFLQQRIVEARDQIRGLLPQDDHDWVKQLPEAIYRSGNLQAYLLHGDCGVHNFIFDSSVLRGVIDPSPMVGPSHYDFLFAFCSSPDDLTMDTLRRAARTLHPSLWQWDDHRSLVEEVLVQLYCRIATCLKYHSSHLPEYLKAWAYWSKLRNEAIT